MASDEDLLQAWRAGDRGAGGTLFERHFSSICRFFANKVGGEVDELVQKTFTACVEGRDRFEGRSSFRTYLFAVAHNVLRAHLRGRKRARERFDLGVTSIHDLGLSPGTFVAQKQEQKLILNALRHVPVEHQVVLELYFWEGLAARELAEILEIPEGTVRGRIRRARQLLDEQLRALAESDALLQSTCSDLEDWASALREYVGRDGPDPSVKPEPPG